MGKFEEFQEQSSVAFLTFVVWVLLPAIGVFYIWLRYTGRV